MKDKKRAIDSKKKMSPKTSKQIIILATIIVLALLLFLIMLLTQYSKVKAEQAKDENKRSYENAIAEVKREEFENGEIVPDRFNMFERMYEGSVDTSQVYLDIYNFIEIQIPDIQRKFKGKTDNEIIKYFSENKERIDKNLGIQNQNDYLMLVNYVKDLDLGEYVSSKFDEVNYKLGETADRVPIEIVFTKNTITIILEIDNEDSDINPIRFLAE